MSFEADKDPYFGEPSRLTYSEALDVVRGVRTWMMLRGWREWREGVVRDSHEYYEVYGRVNVTRVG